LKVVVVGGGVAGMFAAYYLTKYGHDVTVVDKDVDSDRSSIYNAGFITPSFPASGIGMGRILSAAIRPQGPLYFSLAQVVRNPRWFAAGLRNGLSGFEGVIHALGMKSLSLWEEFFSTERVEVDLVKGVLALFNSEDDAERTANSVGARKVTSAEAEQMGYKGFGGGALIDEYSLNPPKLYSELRRTLGEQGVKFLLGAEGKLKVVDGAALGVTVGPETITADATLVAAGAGSTSVCRQFGFDPRILPARGLALIYDTGGNKVVEHPAFFEDLGISLGQHNQDTFRMTSYFELVGFNQEFAESRRRYIIGEGEAHIVEFAKLKLKEAGVGYRPCAPDQLPVLGKLPGVEKAWIASGNCREGVILAPVTGMVAASMISARDLADLPISAVDPRRFA